MNVHNHQSAALNTLTGVPQGSVLGPLLFSLHINNLPHVFSDAEIQLYADDVVIYAHGSTKHQAATELTEAVDHITTWLNQLCLQLNKTKTVSMVLLKKSDVPLRNQP